MDKKNVMSKKAHAMETKRKIYESAEWLFSKYGHENVSVDSIVERAGVAKGSFYVHFKSKDSLIAYFLNDYVVNVDLDYRTYYESFPENSSTSEILLALVRKILNIIANKIGYESMRRIYEVQIAKTVDTQALLNYNRDLYAVFILVINKGIQKNEFKATYSAEMLAKHFVIILRGYLYEWCVRYPDFDLEGETINHFQILLEGLKNK